MSSSVDANDLIPLVTDVSTRRFITSGATRAIEAEQSAMCPVHIAAFQWFTDRVRHDANLWLGSGLVDPLVYVLSVGGGLCDANARGLARLWAAVGHEARVWRLDGHVVPEVRVDGRWEMYDPDLQVSFRTDDGRTAGVEDLRRDPSLMTAPRYVNGRGSSVHALLGRHAEPYARSYRQPLGWDPVAALPALCVQSSPPRPDHDLRYRPEPPPGAGSGVVARVGDGHVVLRLRAHWSGRVRLPLVPWGATGKFRVAFGQEGSCDEGSFSVPDGWSIGAGSFTIDTETSTELTFLANPAVFGSNEPQGVREHASVFEQFDFDYPHLPGLVDLLDRSPLPRRINLLDPLQVGAALAATKASIASADLFEQLAQLAAATSIPDADTLLTHPVVASLNCAGESGDGPRVITYVRWARSDGPVS